MPVITLVINFNPAEWDDPTSIHEMLAIDDEELLAFVPNFRLNLLSPAQLSDEDFDKFRTEFGMVMECVKHSQDQGMDWMAGKDRFKKVTRNTASLIKTVMGLSKS